MSKYWADFLDRDDLQLFVAQFKAIEITFGPSKTIIIHIEKVVNHTEAQLRYQAATLTFEAVLYSDFPIYVQQYEEAEFYRSAKLTAEDIAKSHNPYLKQDFGNGSEAYWFHIDYGNFQEDCVIISKKVSINVSGTLFIGAEHKNFPVNL